MNMLTRSAFSASLASFAVLAGCSSVPRVGEEGNLLPTAAAPDEIRWPARYEPKDATFFVHNEIEIDAPPQAVWDVLIRAESWPEWYTGASDVKIVDGPGAGEAGGAAVLSAGAVFTWTTMDLDFTSTIHEFETPYRLSWESRKSTIQGYHAWLLVPTPRGTRLITDESQHGILAWMQGIFIPNKLRKLHDVWLGQIKRRAEDASAR